MPARTVCPPGLLPSRGELVHKLLILPDPFLIWYKVEWGLSSRRDIADMWPD